MKSITFDIRRMIKLRIKGWSYSRLGREFKKDHTTILYHCKRLGILPREVIPSNVEGMVFEIEEADTTYIPEEKIPVPRVASKYAHLLENEVRNKGKSYAEYLQEALTRPTERRYYQIYYGHYDGPTRTTKSVEEERGEDYEPGPSLV